jgi:uncharacterized surface protein with fasciclin (FAS1) repeats
MGVNIKKSNLNFKIIFSIIKTMYSGPYSASYNFTSMFNMTDKRGQYPITKPCPGTLLDIIDKNPDFSKFRYLVKLANQEEVLNASQANFTIFVPSNESLSLMNVDDNIFINMDSTTAWYIVKSCIIKNKIPSEILEDSPAAYYYTLSEGNRLFITNISGITYLNNSIRVIYKDIMCTNGIIHVIDGLFIPNIL